MHWRKPTVEIHSNFNQSDEGADGFWFSMEEEEDIMITHRITEEGQIIQTWLTENVGVW